MFTNDALQANFGFVLSQTSIIEAGVYQIKYAEIQYPGLIPVDTTGDPWATSVTYMSQDRAGAAAWQSGQARDVPFADIQHNIGQTSVQMASIGYRYTLEEVMQATRVGINLPGDKARAARLASEEFVDKLALTGSTEKNYSGLYNYPGVPVVIAPNGASTSPLWSSKTTDEIIADLNSVIIGGFLAVNTVAMADTLLLPWSRYLKVASTPRTTGSDTSVLGWFRNNNPFTARTGTPLDIRGVRDLDTAGTSSAARMVAYRKAPEVLKLHYPMPLMFLPPQAIGLEYQIPGLFRLGGLDIRLPNEVRYFDGI